MLHREGGSNIFACRWMVNRQTSHVSNEGTSTTAQCCVYAIPMQVSSSSTVHILPQLMETTLHV